MEKLTYDDAIVLSIPKVKALTKPICTVHSDSSEGTKFTVLMVSADLTPEVMPLATQVTNTDLE